MEQPGSSMPAPSAASAILSITFPYSIVVPHGENPEDTDRVIFGLCEDAARQNRCQVAYSRIETTPYRLPYDSAAQQKIMVQHIYVITVVGGLREITTVRGVVLRSNLSQTIVSVRASKKFLMEANGSLKAVAKSRLDAIMQQNKCHVNVLAQTFPKGPGSSSAESSDIIEIEITGSFDAAERARIETLVFVDEMSGLHVEEAEIDPKLHQAIAGRKRANLKQIMQDTMTNIYFPLPFSFQPSKDGGVALEDRRKILIWITGDRYGVQIAKEALLRAAEAKKPNVVPKSVQCAPKKMDWILMNRREQLRKIVNDNGTFVVFPPIGIHHHIVTVYGDDRVYVNRTLRQIMLLVTESITACLQLQQPVFALPSGEFVSNVPGESSIPGPVAKKIQDRLAPIVRSSRSEIVFKANFVEIYGTDMAVKSAFQTLMEESWAKMSIRNNKFQIELAQEHMEFINGKKDGKVNKIKRNTGCVVDFQVPENKDMNMTINIMHTFPPTALEAYNMFEEELPAEISFLVPEAFHKRIIGVGGKNIQRIMKKFGVYVKFSNSEEFNELGGYYENEDNVIARTPAKNANNLESLKLAILDMVTTSRELQDVEMTISIPREFHRTVIGRSGYNAREIEKRTRVQTILPEKETGSWDILLKGPENYLAQAKAMLQDMIPELTAISVVANATTRAVLASDEFLEELPMRIKKDYDVDLLAYVAPEDAEIDHCWIVLEYRRSNLNADHARSWLLDYLASKQITVIHADPARLPTEFPATPTTESLSTAFQHFNNKLFAPANPEQVPVSTFNYSLFDAEGFRASKGAGSAPNLRNLFDDAGRPINPIRKSQSELAENLFMDAVQNRARRLTNSSVNYSEGESYGYTNYDSPTTFFPPQGAPFAPQNPDDSSGTSQPSEGSPPRGGGLRTESSDDGRMSPRMNNMRGWSPPRTVDRAMSPPRRSSPLRSFSPAAARGGYSPVERMEEIFESPDPSDAEEGVISDDLINRILHMSMSDEDVKNPRDKDYLAVKIVLESLGLEKFLDQFIEQEIDFSTFKTLDDSDLRTLGVSTLGARKKILNAVKRLGRFSPVS